MPSIATYVFCDLETTGLPSMESNKTRITEISMVVLKRRHILDSGGELPRVLHKLTMCFNPNRVISDKAAKITRLNNDKLENETPFNKQVVNIIKSFLEAQEQPVCLIAHNGYKFDFPILKNHFELLGTTLDENTLSADSIIAFYDILENPVEMLQVNKKKRTLRIMEAMRTPFYGRGRKPGPSFVLGNIYERVFGRPGPDAHSAENDCIMIAELAAAHADLFVEWIDRNHCKFSDISAM